MRDDGETGRSLDPGLTGSGDGGHGGATATRPAAGPATFPWPPPEDGPVLARFRDTWREAMFRPTAFFRRIPRHGGTIAALSFYLVVGVLVAGVNLFWDTVAMHVASDETMAAVAGFASLPPLTRFLLSPLALVLALGVAAAVTHVLLLVLGGADHGFGTTVRTFSYAYSPMGLSVVPFLGPLVGAAWMVAIGIIGLREAHETATWKPAVAILLPSTIALAALAMMATAIATLGSAG